MPNAQLSLPERSALVALMMLVTEAANTDIDARFGFTIDKLVRERLEKAGYITSRKKGRGIAHELTDPGWRRCREELSTPPPDRAPKPYRLLYGALQCIADHLTRSDGTIGDFFPPPSDPSTAAIAERIRSEYKVLAAEPGAWVSLTRLRAAVGDLPRACVDEALLALDLQPAVSLIPEANQKALSASDRAAAIRIGGEDKHLLSIERS
jgi:hypothetical protein